MTMLQRTVAQCEGGTTQHTRVIGVTRHKMCQTRVVRQGICFAGNRLSLSPDMDVLKIYFSCFRSGHSPLGMFFILELI